MSLSLTYKGFDYPAYYNGAYENANSLQSLATTGANSVELSLDYGIDPQTNTVYSDPNYTDSLTALGAEIRQATSLGLSVMVRPLIDFVDPADMTGTPYTVDEWRGYYNPGPAGSASANAFFASYQTMILQEAQVAVANGATSLSIGTELDQITGPAYEGYWNAIITAVRTDDPTLKLTYSADWDDDISPWQWGGTGLAVGTGNLATQVSFASELDSIGIDEYAPISDATNPTLAQLIAGWTQVPTDATTKAVTGNQSLISYYESVAAQVGKPLLFTEIGYENASDAAEQPAYTSTGVVDNALQAQLYQAFFQAWSQAGNSSLTGVYFWNWDPNAAEVGPGNGTNFSPQGLPAQAVVTDWFSPPPAPSGLALSPASDSGVQGDDITNVTTPVITGSGQVGDTVALDDGSTAVGSATVGSNGNWSITTSILANGVHTLTATESSGGSTSAGSAALVLTIDTVPPQLVRDNTLSVTAGQTATISPSLLAFSDVVANDPQKLFSVITGPQEGTLLLNGSPTTSFTEADLDNDLVSYHETASTATSDSFTFMVSDNVGNTTALQYFNIEMVPYGLTLSPASDSGVQGDDITNVTTPVITGSGQAGDTVALDDGSTAVGSATVGSNGNWSITTSFLANGVHTLTATESSGGSTSAGSAALVLTIDTVPPQLVRDNTLSVTAGQTATISPSLLAFSDVVANDPQKLFSVITGPQEGTLLLNGSTTTSFTEADLDNGLVAYHETASNAASDSFTFTVSDNVGNTTALQHFNILI